MKLTRIHNKNFKIKASNIDKIEVSNKYFGFFIIKGIKFIITIKLPTIILGVDHIILILATKLFLMPQIKIPQ